MNSILLIITGSIAAEKIPELIRFLRNGGVDITCVVTKSGQEFITLAECEKLTGKRAYSDMFPYSDEMEHIRLSRENDLVVVAPATANILAKMAYGLADDLASALLLASNKRTLVAPAMNVHMWENPATQRNIGQLKQDGIAFIGPNKGDLACGEEGFGRMSEPAEIAAAVMDFLQGGGDRRAGALPLSGKTALVTAGATIEPIDPARYISNHSSGKQGYTIAQELHSAGADVTLVSGAASIPPPANISVVNVESAEEMLQVCERLLPVDIAVFAAAVADWRVAEPLDNKLKKSTEPPTLKLTENPDILQRVSQHKTNRPGLVIGFAAESEKLADNARKKLKNKGCDWIIANDISDAKVFGADENEVEFFSSEKHEKWPRMSKQEVAERLANEVVEFFAQNS